VLHILNKTVHYTLILCILLTVMGDPRLNFKDVYLSCVLCGFVVPAIEVISYGMLCRVVFFYANILEMSASYLLRVEEYAEGIKVIWIRG
jgi:hypothetical protein